MKLPELTSTVPIDMQSHWPIVSTNMGHILHEVLAARRPVVGL